MVNSVLPFEGLPESREPIRKSSLKCPTFNGEQRKLSVNIQEERDLAGDLRRNNSVPFNHSTDSHGSFSSNNRSNDESAFQSASASKSTIGICSSLSIATLWDRYLLKLEQRPLLVKTLTASFCGVISESLSRKIAGADANRKPLWKGCLQQVLLSLLFRGPVMHYWTTYLNKAMVHRDPGIVLTLQKVAVHETVYDPIFVICFMTLLRLTNGETPLAAFQGAKQEFGNALKTQYTVWPPIQLINYGFVPAKLQVLFISCVAILTNAYLTYLSKKKKV